MILGKGAYMFQLDYRIVHSEYDDFIGQNGFLQIKCNECKYGEIYPRNVEMIMDKVSLYDWFERFARVIKYLMTKDYVVLSDVESYNTWIEFRRENEYVIVSIIKAKKEEGSHDIEFNLEDTIAGEWEKQVVCYRQLKTEIIEKLRGYVAFITTSNTENSKIEKLSEILKSL